VPQQEGIRFSAPVFAPVFVMDGRAPVPGAVFVLHPADLSMKVEKLKELLSTTNWSDIFPVPLPLNPSIVLTGISTERVKVSEKLLYRDDIVFPSYVSDH
jgi:hypothetical protein